MSGRLNRLYDRRIDPIVTNAKGLNEVYNRITQSDSVKYVLGAMQPIDPEYTKVTFGEGDRVWNQLAKALSMGCEMRFQGSTTNDTHIKAKSDIDLLTIVTAFHDIEPPQTPFSPYGGNPTQDMIDLRNEEIAILSNAFPEVSVDTSGSKAIALDGGSLRRKVDVVPSNWYNTNLYTEKNDEVYRGVKIFDCKTNLRIPNTPFLHNALIKIKDYSVNGGLRKAARLMKSLKYDTENVDLSSYDIVAIAYNMDDKLLIHTPDYELKILSSCTEYCERLLGNEFLRNSILVPDGYRTVFKDGHATIAGLEDLTRELHTLQHDVLTENSRSFSRLSEARVQY